MKPVLVVYATREGQTRHIAEHACGRLAAQQFACELVDAAHVPETFALENYAAVIAGASLHRAKHEPEMTAFVRRYLPQLQEIPTLFLSVSLSETTVEDPNAPPEKRDKAREDVKRTIDEFLAETGWRPTQIAGVAGALPYSKYNFVMRFVMKQIAKKAGGPTDTSRDYEFTNWTELDRLVTEFAGTLPAYVQKGSSAGTY